MTSIARVYTDAVRGHWIKLFGNWDPNEPLELGDFGTLDGNIFTRTGNIRSKDLTFRPRPDQENAHYEFTSSAGVNVQSKAKATIGGVNVNARVEITFSRENLVFFNAAGCLLNSIEDQEALGASVLDLYKSGRWDASLAIVTSLVQGEATSIFVSSGTGATVVLEASSPAVQTINLSDASIGLHLETYSNVGLHVTAERGLNPLMGLSKVRPKRWPVRPGPDFGRVSVL